MCDSTDDGDYARQGTHSNGDPKADGGKRLEFGTSVSWDGLWVHESYRHPSLELNLQEP